ncbi:type II toxin-antitoxin system RelE/ParE family toxin [Vibrio sp. JC009]|uniref:type II toxin-antitoxin system RelE/ParE family toxin n=1 Tax=Vibrio sp. JC009 TaxID=2912314 RepID=UPI0023AFFDA5|nr:type II toxin-antitoxin system RelE/ParE family toxin [Vibrio sp. JC009]WED22473.1 type II toxin-antitoxin system RelE/ParE family toxin [Vibrio sp. JC009]
MNIYKTKAFQRSFKKTALTDEILKLCCLEMEHGLIDADYGGHLYKKRVAMPGRGKSGSYRTMIGARLGDSYFFLYLFPKKAQSNIDKAEEKALKELARHFLDKTSEDLARMVSKGLLFKLRGEE